jgi:hypothetical protein
MEFQVSCFSSLLVNTHTYHLSSLKNCYKVMLLDQHSVVALFGPGTHYSQLSCDDLYFLHQHFLPGVKLFPPLLRLFMSLFLIQYQILFQLNKIHL